MKIFISYRREDNLPQAQAFASRFQKRPSVKSVFYDLEGIKLAEDWKARLDAEIVACDVVIAMIGPRWAGPLGVRGWRILEPEDPVRWEIARAFELGKTVVPVFVNCEAVDGPAELPADLARLPELNGHFYRDKTGPQDFAALCKALGLAEQAPWPVRLRRAAIRFGLGALIGVVLVAAAAVAHYETLSRPLEDTLGSPARVWAFIAGLGVLGILIPFLLPGRRRHL